MSLRLAPFAGRNQLGQHLNELGLVGTGVEIGTHRGVFANELLSRWKGETLICVDPWAENIPDYAFQASILRTDLDGAATRQEDLEAAKALLGPYGARVIYWRGTSLGALSDKSGSFDNLDFAYIDGNHLEAYVREDVWGWWHRLKKGGMLAAHDFLAPGEDLWGRVVQAVILKLSQYENVDVYLVTEDGLPWSCYLIKP